MFSEDEAEHKITSRITVVPNQTVWEAFYTEQDNKRLTVNAPKYTRVFNIECLECMWRELFLMLVKEPSSRAKFSLSNWKWDTSLLHTWMCNRLNISVYQILSGLSTLWFMMQTKHLVNIDLQTLAYNISSNFIVVRTSWEHDAMEEIQDWVLV